MLDNSNLKPTIFKVREFFFSLGDTVQRKCQYNVLEKRAIGEQRTDFAPELIPPSGHL